VDVSETVLIESLAAGGDGVGRLADGMAVFVPRTAPGDRVRLADVRRRRRHAHASLAAVEAPGPGRVEPPCPHFTHDGCGGCQWQHLGAAAQRAAKARIVGDALRRLGHIDVPDPEVVASPRDLGYRATITLTVRWTPAGPVAGFHDHRDPARVIPLERCAIAREEVAALWDALRPAIGALPRGSDVRLKLRVAPDGGLHAVVAGGDGAWTTPGPLVEAAAARGLPVTVWWEPTGGAARRMAGATADRSAVAFEQVNPEVAAALRAAVLEAAPADAGGRALDLYAGAGEVGLALAGRGWEVATVETNEAAVARTAERARREGLAVRIIAGRVEERLHQLLPARLVVANPPRAGLDPRAATALAARMPEWLVYVSCDPATLARDLRRLGASAERLALRCFDMFPQTGHVETLAVLDGG
jgi:23S rRNA (uracil1939-C5)-methyltransferase